MKTLRILSVAAALMLGVAGCQDDEIKYSDMVMSAVDLSQVSGAMNGDDYTLKWTQSGKMQVTVYRDGVFAASEIVDGNSYTLKNVPTNVQFEFVLKATDGDNFSKGVIKTFKRDGASSVTGLMMSQLEVDGGYDAKAEWDAPDNATELKLTATNGTSTITETLKPSVTEYVIKNVVSGEAWDVSIVAVNADGPSLPTSTSLKIGKTTIGFLSVYATADELISTGDDDEASAWLWLHAEYPTAQFVPFSNITSAQDLDNFRVLFWLRDLESVTEGDVTENDIWTMPDVVINATPAIKEWYKNGGSLLLWGHATPYIGTLGRLDFDMLKDNDHAFGFGEGGINNDVWKMAVTATPGGNFSVDFSTHPLYKGIETETAGNNKLIAMKGAGWTEDHNCLYFNIPAVLTGKGNQDEACYTELTGTYGIYPLGTWDSQCDYISQLNVWEARQGNTDFLGTILCIGNGGCEFSMKNPDGTPDISASPKNNSCQPTVLKMAKNALEYLKTR